MWAKNFAKVLLILILKYSSGPEELTGHLRNGPLHLTCAFVLEECIYCSEHLAYNISPIIS